MFRIDPRNPYRPVNWRWQRANWLLKTKGGKCSRRLDDARVRQAIDFLKRYQAANGDEEELLKVFEKMPHYFMAFEIYMSDTADVPEASERLSCELYLLSRLSDSFIAMQMNVAPEVISIYHDLFFDIRDRRECLTFVMNHVVGKQVHFGLRERQYSVNWKQDVRQRGWHMAELHISGLELDNVPSGSREGALAHLSTSNKTHSIAKMNQAIRTIPVANHNFELIIQGYYGLLNSERDKGGDTSRDSFTHGMDLTLKEGTHWEPARSEQPMACLPGAADNNTLLDYHAKGVEPRSNQLLGVVYGTPLAAPPDVTFREPEKPV